GAGSRPAFVSMPHRFSRRGAHPALLARDATVFYHAAAASASTYLVPLLDTAIQTYARAGIPQDVAQKMMAALVRETAENVLRTSPEQALTGPIARGDMETVQRQYRALHAADATQGRLYKQLGLATARLAQRRKTC